MIERQDAKNAKVGNAKKCRNVNLLFLFFPTVLAFNHSSFDRDIEGKAETGVHLLHRMGLPSRGLPLVSRI